MNTQFMFSGYLEPEEVRAIISAIPVVSPLHFERDSLLLELLWQSGARVSEAIILTPEKIGMTSVFLKNLKQIKKIAGKKVRDEGATKEVEVSKDLCQRLKDFCQENDIKEGEWVFKGNRFLERHLSPWYVWWIVGKASSKAGVFRFGKKHPKTGGRYKSAYPHLFRHSNAMHLLEQIGDITIVKEQLGHASVHTTQGYAYAKKPKIKKEVAKIQW